MRPAVLALTRAAALALPLLFLAACQGVKVDAAAQRTAREAYTDLRTGQEEALVGLLEPAQKTPTARKMIGTLRTIIPPGEPMKVTTVGWQTFVGTAGATVTINDRYDYPGGQIVTTSTVLVADKAHGGWLIRGFNVNRSVSSEPAVKAPGVA